MLFIGDVHGCFNPYKKVTESADSSLQLGDMGNGFRTRMNKGGVTRSPELNHNHKFIRGNHDDPSVCRSHP